MKARKGENKKNKKGENTNKIGERNLVTVIILIRLKLPMKMGILRLDLTKDKFTERLR